MEALSQLGSQGGCRGLPVALELSVVSPELVQEVGQKPLVMGHEGGQLLVVASFMDPTERLLPGNVDKLGLIYKYLN